MRLFLLLTEALTKILEQVVSALLCRSWETVQAALSASQLSLDRMSPALTAHDKQKTGLTL
jgi:hypothetical protein